MSITIASKPLLGWLGTKIARWLLRRVLKRVNAAGKGHFSRELAFEIRKKIIGEIQDWVVWAKVKTPTFTVDEDALQCAAWVLESDTLQRQANGITGKSQDVHARWNRTTP